MCRRLVLVLAACVAVLLVRELRADACGVKLNIKAPRVKKQADRSTNPSQILLLGDPPRALSKELSSRGHKVEVAASADEARRVKYHAIVADPDQEQEAKTRWPGALVVVRRGNAKSDANLVEEQIGASPTRTLVSRTPERTSRGERAPIRTGPPRDDGRGGPVAAGGGANTEERAVAASGGGSVSAGANVAAAPSASDAADNTDEPATKPTRTRVATRTTTPATEDVNADEGPDRGPAHFTRRIFFGNSASDLSSRARVKLTRNARWLQRHADRSVLVQGHASTTGAPEPNQALSEARARAVKEFLVEQGVAETRIQTEGLGMTKPEYKPGYSAKNRRVVITLQ